MPWADVFRGSAGVVGGFINVDLTARLWVLGANERCAPVVAELRHAEDLNPLVPVNSGMPGYVAF